MSDLGTQGGDNTATGFLVGTEPAQPRKAADWNGQQNPAQQVSQPVQVVDTQPAPNGRMFSEDDIAKARQQEKDKLYPQLEDMKAQLKEIEKERRELAKARKDEEDRIAAEAKAKEEEQLELRELITRKDQEWQQKFSSIETERERDRATFQREKELLELEAYKRDRLAQDAEYIAPELRDLVRGNTIQEVDASIEDLKARTNAIFGNISAVASQQQAAPRGASPTAPSVGPMEQLPNYEQLTPEDIRSMDIDTYKKYRANLLAAASNQYRGQRR